MKTRQKLFAANVLPMPASETEVVDEASCDVTTSSAIDPVKKSLNSRATLALHPASNGAAVLARFSGFGEQDEGALLESLCTELNALADGSMKRAEGMLLAQAHALQGIFVHMAGRASKQTHASQTEALMRMALKAQNQCRMTLETLSNMRNPALVIARQANFAGHQQINNGAAAAVTTTIVNGIEFPPNEILESNDG